MKRRLTSREWFLLGLLVVVALVSGYFQFFRAPMQAELANNEAERLLQEEVLAAAQVRLEEQRRMERELAELFASDDIPRSLAPYDNLQQVMTELSFTLSQAEEYSLSFGTVETGGPIVRRNIAMRYTAGSYPAAKGILQRLHDSAYRCMLDDLGISLSDTTSQVSVNGTLVFFEYIEAE